MVKFTCGLSAAGGRTTLMTSDVCVVVVVVELSTVGIVRVAGRIVVFVVVIRPISPAQVTLIARCTAA